MMKKKTPFRRRRRFLYTNLDSERGGGNDLTSLACFRKLEDSAGFKQLGDPAGFNELGAPTGFNEFDDPTDFKEFGYPTGFKGLGDPTDPVDGGGRQLSDSQLRQSLKQCDKSDVPTLYRLVKEVILRRTGLSLFDSQLRAAYSMQRGRIAELPTGEGKTLSAVLAAVCLALNGRRVHILTFNDYLSQRDFLQSRDIFEFCGLTSAFIQERAEDSERKAAYSCDVVYVSAKQAGFDYLKSFLCTDPDALLPLAFDAAIVDEADSILLDEARIPLVLAGGAPFYRSEALTIDAVVACLPPGSVARDKLDKQDKLNKNRGPLFGSRFWLTDSGITAVEKALHLDNLYDEENTDTLALVNAAIEARYLLTKDVDYIVRNDRVSIIDPTTGRIALARRFPAVLQQAVECKEKLTGQDQTIIYNSMPLQFFLLKYDFLCGMTGTAETSRREFLDLYGLPVDVISPHAPCIRIDHPDIICETEEEKRRQVIRQIERCHRGGQPVLVGTQSVMESEQYSRYLTEAGLPHTVLNAKNDEAEAGIIRNAGAPYAITISTNMAGRGVDIKLGGADEAQKEFVREAGGLFVIGCGLNESSRLDKQLAGRAGRQGDPGESRFFISREDPLLAGLSGSVRSSHPDSASSCRTAPAHAVFSRTASRSSSVRRVQRAAERRSVEARYLLGKYAYILELQRRRITSFHEEILLEHRTPGFFQAAEPDCFQRAVQTSGAEGVRLAEKQLTLFFLNRHWADYLCTMEMVRSGIHLSIIGGLNPIDEYHKAAVSAFSEMQEDIENDVVVYMKECTITASGIDLEEAGLSGATSTCTYMVDESRSQFARLPHLSADLFVGMRGSLFSLRGLAAKGLKTLQNIRERLWNRTD